MPNLKCHDHTCDHNYCTHCTKKGIQVSNTAYCRSYEKRRDDDSKLAQWEYEFASDQPFSLETDEHVVLCDASSCRHFYANKCTVHHLRVDRKEVGAKCINYIEKYR